MSDISKSDIDEALGTSDGDWEDVNTSDSQSWDFKEQKILTGVYTGSREVVTKYGTKRLYEVETKDHKLMSVWSTAMIERFFEKLETGVEVRIEFQGKEQNKNGQPVNVFKFQVRR